MFNVKRLGICQDDEPELVWAKDEHWRVELLEEVMFESPLICAPTLPRMMVELRTRNLNALKKAIDAWILNMDTLPNCCAIELIAIAKGK